MTVSHSSDKDSNVIPLFGRREDPKAPTRLSEEGVAEFLHENFDIDVPVSTTPDKVGCSNIATDELDDDINKERRILGMATTVIFEQVDTEGYPTVKIVPQDDATSKWLREIRIFKESLIDTTPAEEPDDSAFGSLLLLFDKNRDTEKDV